MEACNNLENEIPSDTYWRDQLVCKKVQTPSSLEPPLEYNQDNAFDKSWFLMTFLTILRVTEIFGSSRRENR